MADPESTVEQTADALRRLVSLVVDNGLAELSVEESGVTITVKGLVDPLPPLEMSAPTPIFMHPHALSPSHEPPYSQTPVLPRPSAAPAPAARAANLIALESPMVGVFYRSASPEDPPFVSVGDVISVGQTVGLIEAMKVYSELPSEVSGRITEIMAANGKLVQQGQPLLYVEPV